MDALRKLGTWVKRHVSNVKRDEQPATTRIEDRPLSGNEISLIQWLIEHGEPEARKFAAQVQSIRVVGSCGCGCPTIDFDAGSAPMAIGDAPRVLADFVGYTPEGWQVGVLLHQSGGRLSYLEVYNLSEHEGAFSLPDVSTLIPFGNER